MVVDLDSHLREGYFLDEVYRLDGPYAKYTPVKVTGGRDHRTHFLHSLEVGDARARAIFRHPYMYDPKYDPEVAERQIGGYDMERRLVDIRKEGIHKQIIFPTGIGIPTVNAGGLGLALCRAYNDWVAGLVKGYEDILARGHGAGGMSGRNGQRASAVRQGTGHEGRAPRSLLRATEPGRPCILPVLRDGRGARRAALLSPE